MTESERERVYGIGALILVLLSPFSFQHLRAASMVPELATWQFVLVMAATIPGVILLEIPLSLLMGRQGGFRFWVKNPGTRTRMEVKHPLEPARAEIERRLTELGFEISEMDGVGIRFRKPKIEPTNAFIDNAFSGISTLRDTGFGTEIETELQLNDTVILETGESRGLEALARYVSLEGDDFLLREIPFTLYCGLLAALVTGVLSLAAVHVGGLDPWITSVSAGAAGMLAFSIYFVLKDRKRLYGFKLAFLGLYLAAVPWVAFVFP